MMKRDTCIQELKDTILDKEDELKTFEECKTLLIKWSLSAGIIE